jgi:hypothetical protein
VINNNIRLDTLNNNCKFNRTISNKYWRDTICQNNLRLNYTPQPMAASVQTPPVYDFIGTTSAGVNAYFIRKDLSSPFKKFKLQI